MPSSDCATPILNVIELIICKNREIAEFWSQPHGWAPMEAAELLSKSRLDRQVSLSQTLALWVPPAASATSPDIDGRLILGWANLGALIEGSLKWFLSVYYEDYKNDIKAIRKNGDISEPEGVKLELLRHFFAHSVWIESDDWDGFIAHVQSRRNSIHSYQDREIGTLTDLKSSIRKYRDFLYDLDSRAPYP